MREIRALLVDGPCRDQIIHLDNLKPKTVTHDRQRWEYSFTGEYEDEYALFKVTNYWEGRLPTLTNVKDGDDE